MLEKKSKPTPLSPETCPRCGHYLFWERSIDAHKWFFGPALGLIYDNWPESFWWQPFSREHLRAFLLVRVGKCVPIDEPVSKYDADACEEERLLFAADLIKAAAKLRRYTFKVRMPQGHWVIVTPMSMGEDTMDQRVFGQTVHDMCDEVKALIGYDVEQVMKDLKGKKL